MWNHLAELFAGVSVAHAMTPPGGGGEGQPGFLIQMAPFFMIFAIIYFVMIRPQQKRQQEQEWEREGAGRSWRSERTS